MVLDRPAVGQNLQDHPNLVIQLASAQPVTLRRHASGVGRIVTGLKSSPSARRGGRRPVRGRGLCAPATACANPTSTEVSLAIWHADYQPYAQRHSRST